MRNELPFQAPGAGLSLPPASPLMKGVGLLLAAGGAVAMCNGILSRDEPHSFDANEAFVRQPDPKADAIRTLVEKDAARCMALTYQSSDLLRHDLGQIIDLTNTAVSSTCVPFEGVSSGRKYTFQTGPEDCSNILTTIDGKEFISSHFYGNCDTGLPPAVQ